MATVLYPNDKNYKWKGKANEAVFGVGDSVPAGVEALFQFNGIVLNDRSVLDKYRVKSIDGLDDPDIRDTRENKPNDDGEDAYTSNYAGRTIVINLTIEAFSLNKLRDMEEALRTAFSDIKEEKPLYFVTSDSKNDHYIMVKKSQKMQKQEDITQYQGRFFRDWQITLRASDPRFRRNRSKSLSTMVNISNPDLNPSSGFNTSALSSGYNIGGNFLSSAFVGTSSISSNRFNVTNFSEMLFGYKLESNVRPNTAYDFSASLSWTRNNVLATWGYFTPYVTFFNSSGGYLSHQQLATVNVSFFTSRQFSTTIVTPNNNNIAQIGFYLYFNDGSNPDKAIDYLHIDNYKIALHEADASVPTLEVINEGNYSSYPIIKLYGGMSNIEVINDNNVYPKNAIKFKNSVTIANGNYYVIDVKRKKVYDKNGNNKINDLDISSGWLDLVPGQNNIRFGEDTEYSSANAQIEIEFQDSWI